MPEPHVSEYDLYAILGTPDDERVNEGQGVVDLPHDTATWKPF